MKLAWFWMAMALAAQTEWEKLTQQAEQLYLKGDLKAALAAAERSLPLAATPRERALSLDRTGFLLHQNGRFPESEPPLREALALREKLGKESQDYASTALNLAMLMRDTRRTDEAIALARAGAEIRLRLSGATPVYAEALNILGTAQYMAGRFADGEASFDEAIRIHESVLDPANPSEEYGTLCANFAGSSQRNGRYAKAKLLFQKALAALAKRPGKNHPAYSVTLSASAFLEQDMGNFDVAHQRYGESIGLLLAQFGEAHPTIGTVFNNQGVLFLHMGDYQAAETAFMRSLAIRRKVGEPVSLAVTLRNYASVVWRRDRPAAAQLFQEAVDSLERAPSRPPYEYGNALLSLGRTHRQLSKLPEARIMLERALGVFEKALGPRNPFYGQGLTQMSMLWEAEDRLSEAERDIRRAIAITLENKGPDHPEQAANLAVLARLLRKQGKPAAALDQYREALRIQGRTFAQLVAVGSESAKAAMLAQFEDLTPALLEFAETAGPLRPQARELALEAVASQKGRTLDFMRDWQTQLREHPQLDEWRKVLDCEAALMVAVGYRDWQRPTAGGCALTGSRLAGRYETLAHEIRTGWNETRAAAAVKAIAELRQHASTLEETLSRHVPALYQNRIGVTEMRARLEPGAALLEIAAHRPIGPGQQEPRYGAFLLLASGGVEWADLGPTTLLDQTVRDLLQAAEDWSKSQRSGRARAAAAVEQTATQAIQRLSAAFAPLLQAHPELHRLRIAPDGMLQLVPFEALLLGGRPWLERFAVSYLQAGRELVQAAPPAAALGRSVIVISPGAGAAAQPVAASAFRAGELERLSSALPEARQLKARLRQPQLLGEREATEAAVKQVSRPALLHLIGHGVVRGKENCSPCELDALAPAARVMNLSAIVLEEAYGRGGTSPQDGLLTAQELRSLDLTGTQMVVLSQCRMADGVPASGDGVHGMRRAVAFSGARSFVAPLWKVADGSQQAMMDRFYSELQSGRDRAEALRRAKLALARRPASRHFLHWAAPMLFGDAGPLAAGVFVP